MPDVSNSSTSVNNVHLQGQQMSDSFGSSSAFSTQEFETTRSLSPTLSTIADTTSLLPVLNHAQLQVILPITQSHISQVDVPHMTGTRASGIQTRLQTEAISRQNCDAYLSSLPELTSLQSLDDFIGGFSFLADVSDVDEPKTFKVASSKSQW